MNNKIIDSEMMKNDTQGFDDESNKKNGCDLHNCSIRILYLDITYLFCTSNTAIWNRKYMLI